MVLPATWIDHVPVARGISSVVILLVGTFFAVISARLVERWCVARYDARRARILRRVFHYSAMVLVILIALDELGVGVGVLLGVLRGLQSRKSQNPQAADSHRPGVKG